MKISSGRISRQPTNTHTRRRQRGDRMKVGASVCKEEKHLTVLRYHGTWSRTRLHYKDRPFKTVQRNDCCLLRIWRNKLIILYFVDRASRYISVKKTNLIYFVNQSLHFSGIFVSHLQEVYCMYTTRTHYYIYALYLLMMGYKYVRNMLRLIDEINWG